MNLCTDTLHIPIDGPRIHTSLFCLFKSRGNGVALNWWTDKFLSNGESRLDISLKAEMVSWFLLQLFLGHKNSAGSLTALSPESKMERWTMPRSACPWREAVTHQKDTSEGKDNIPSVGKAIEEWGPWVWKREKYACFIGAGLTCYRRTLPHRPRQKLSWFP